MKKYIALLILIIILVSIVVFQKIRIKSPASSIVSKGNKQEQKISSSIKFGSRQQVGFFSFVYPVSWVENMQDTSVTLTAGSDKRIIINLPKTVSPPQELSAVTFSQKSLSGQKPIFLKAMSIDGHLSIEQAKHTVSGERVEAFIENVVTPSGKGIYHVTLDTPSNEYSENKEIFDAVLGSLKFPR